MIKNRKGFTLVELLAVIVILAVILAIAVPSITNITTQAKEDSFEANVKLIINSLDLYNLSNPSTQICDTATSGSPCTMSGANITSIGLNSADYTAIIVNGTDPTSLSTVTPAAGSKFVGCSLSADSTYASVSAGC